jgi:hypothetical protein
MGLDYLSYISEKPEVTPGSDTDLRAHGKARDSWTKETFLLFDETVPNRGKGIPGNCSNQFKLICNASFVRPKQNPYNLNSFP